MTLRGIRFLCILGWMKNSVQSLHTTGLGALRIKRNLNLETDDVVAWSRAALAATSPDSVIRRGKNYYIWPRLCPDHKRPQ